MPLSLFGWSPQFRMLYLNFWDISSRIDLAADSASSLKRCFETERWLSPAILRSRWLGFYEQLFLECLVLMPISSTFTVSSWLKELRLISPGNGSRSCGFLLLIGVSLISCFNSTSPINGVTLLFAAFTATFRFFSIPPSWPSNFATALFFQICCYSANTDECGEFCCP